MEDAAIPDAGERRGYPDCKFCGGWGFYRVVGSDTFPEGSTIGCGNCTERRKWEGLEREPQKAWCVWTKTGRRPTYWHDSREKAESEAARLARKYPGKTFIVFEKLVNIRTTQETKAKTADAQAKATTPKTYRGWSISWEYGNFYAVHPDYDASWEGPEDGWVDNGLKVCAPTIEALHEEIDEKQGEWNEINGQFGVGA